MYAVNNRERGEQFHGERRKNIPGEGAKFQEKERENNNNNFLSPNYHECVTGIVRHGLIVYMKT